MASVSKPMQNGRRLFEILEKQQEPFLLDVYLLEHGYSDRKLRSQPTFCWPGSSCRRLKRLGSYSFKRRRGGILRCVLNKVICGKVMRKALTWKYTGLGSRRWSTVFGSFFDIGGKNHAAEFHRLSHSGANDESVLDVEHKWKEMEEDSKQLSPVSVLELHSGEDSPIYNDFKKGIASTASATSPRETKQGSWVGLEEIVCSALVPDQNMQFSQPHYILLDYLREAEGRLWDTHECSSSPERRTGNTIEEEDNFLWEKQLEGLANISQLIDFDISKSRKEWSHCQLERREIGVEIETSIFEDIREEIVWDMLDYHCTLQ